MIQAIPIASTAHLLAAAASHPNELEGVLPRDEGEARHHEHVGDDDRPAGRPAALRAHRLADPGERRAAVRVGAVEVVVGRRDAEHREERDDHDRRRMQADAPDRGDHAERRRQRVARRRGGDADDDVGDVADRVLLEAPLTRPLCDRRPRRAELSMLLYLFPRRIVLRALRPRPPPDHRHALRVTLLRHREQHHRHGEQEDHRRQDVHLRRDRHPRRAPDVERVGDGRSGVEVGDHEVVDRQREGEQRGGEHRRRDQRKRDPEEGL